MKGRQIRYEPEELAWIKARKEMPRRELHELFCAYWRRDDVNFDNFKALCSRNGWKTGRTGCFTKGLVPHNKGKAMPPEVRAKCLPTAFKKGNEPHNTKELGAERITVEGYVEISVAKVNPHTGYPRSYVLKHRHLWEQINGPVPDGYVLKALDGNRQNTDPSNWELIPRALLPRLVGGRWGGINYDQADDQLKPSIMAVAKLSHAIREARK